jgi:hypothetical protein
MGKTNTVDDTSVIDYLDFNLTCDYLDCEGTATHRLVCPECKMYEFMCDSHAKAAKLAKKGSWIVFDKSCKHRVDMYNCGKEAISP